MKKLIFVSLLVVMFGYFATNARRPITEIINRNFARKETIEIKPITLESIFLGEDNSQNIPIDETVTILATGDVLLARSVNAKTVTSNNFNWPFEKTYGTLRNADITFINLETPIVDNCPITHTGMIFCSDPRNIEGLKFAGIDVVNIANNHMFDQGTEGHSQTYSKLTNNGFLVSGFNGPIYKEVKGIKFSFLGYNDVNFSENIDQQLLDKIKNEIALARQNSDVVIVQIHWGNEYTTEITKRQRTVARHAIDSGADLIIGNHAHWIQPVEIYKEKLITYAHGNFVFDQEWSLKTKLGVVGYYSFYKSELIKVKFVPILIENFGQPKLLEGNDMIHAVNELKDLSSKK